VHNKLRGFLFFLEKQIFSVSIPHIEESFW